MSRQSERLKTWTRCSSRWRVAANPASWSDPMRLARPEGRKESMNILIRAAKSPASAPFGEDTAQQVNVRPNRIVDRRT